MGDDRNWSFVDRVERNPSVSKTRADQAAFELVEALRKRGVVDADLHQALVTLTKRVQEDRDFVQGIFFYIRNWKLLTTITVRT